MTVLQKKDIGNLINATLVAMFAASTKAYDPYVYTPKGLPGRNKNDVLSAINDPIINTIQAVQSTQDAIQKSSINTISNTLQDINDTANNVAPIKDIATIANTVLNPINNVAGLITNPTNHIQSSILNPINNILNINEEEPYLVIPFDNPKTNLELITRQETWYKLESVDSSTLSNNKKIKVDSNISLFIDDYAIDKETNHIIFNVGERVFYAYLDHIQLLDGGVQLLF